MARIPSLKLSCLNITIHPNPSPEKYLEMFHNLLSLNSNVTVRKMIVMLNEQIINIDDEPLNGFTGKIEVCTNINTKLPFYDTTKKEPILDNQGKAVSQLPNSIKPEYREVSFVFYPKDHRLIFDCKRISPNMFLAIFEKLILNQKSEDQIITVILEKDRESIEKIKNITKLEALSFTISLPNGDSLRKTTKDRIDELKTNNIHTLEQVKKAMPGSTGIVINDEDIDWLEISVSNGTATGKGKDENNKSVTYSTKEYPIIKTEQPKTKQPFLTTFKEKAEVFLKEIIGRLE